MYKYVAVVVSSTSERKCPSRPCASSNNTERHSKCYAGSLTQASWGKPAGSPDQFLFAFSVTVSGAAISMCFSISVGKVISCSEMVTLHAWMLLLLLLLLCRPRLNEWIPLAAAFQCYLHLYTTSQDVGTRNSTSTFLSFVSTWKVTEAERSNRYSRCGRGPWIDWKPEEIHCFSLVRGASRFGLHSYAGGRRCRYW